MFIDHAIIFCHAGKGGKGCQSFEPSRNPRHRRPTGGDGGRGGSVLITADPQVHTLLDLQMRKTFHAFQGRHGGSNRMNGGEGADIRVRVPCGTEVFDDATGLLLKDMVEPDSEVNVARGGQGGKGNDKKNAATEGEPGESRTVKLELKLIADVGLVGFPNAGKSTLISHISNARSKIAPYPFTTREPVLGVVQSSGGDSFVVADIPGLIEGAHRGKGMGHEFLRHIERTKMILQVIDMAGVDGRDPVEDSRILNEELRAFSPIFAEKPRVIAVNKMDIPAARENFVKFKQKISDPIFEISAATGQGLDRLVRDLFHKVTVRDEGKNS